MRLGPRFLSMNNAYDRDFRRLAYAVAEVCQAAEVWAGDGRGWDGLVQETGYRLREGVYFMVGGPQFETAAEVRMQRLLGGDVAGMSVAHESIAARHCGVKVLAMSLVTNMFLLFLPASSLVLTGRPALELRDGRRRGRGRQPPRGSPRGRG